jgi:NADPH2:quinone reductase
MTSALPSTNHVIEIGTVGGGPEVLRLVPAKMPEPGSGEVLIRNAAMGVNRGDMGQRRGTYPPPPGVTAVPGLEVAGTVVATGPGVHTWRVGDSVCALLAGGGYAEYSVAPQEQCLPIPQGTTLIGAAALPETCATVWSTVWEQAQLGPGETLLVQGGASGIGVTAIQIAKALGHKVFVTAGSDERCRACIELGADLAINYKTQDFVEEVKRATGGRGVNVILDMVGGSYVPREMAALAEEGRIVFIAFLGGSSAELDIRQMMYRRLKLTGSTLRSRPVAYKGRVLRKVEEIIWPLVEQQRVKPVIHATFPLARACDAHALMESGQHIGKIVLTTGAQ